VSRRAVEVEVVLLDVLAVVALAVGEPEEALLEDGIPAVPQGQGEAQVLLVIGKAGDAVLAPAVGTRAGVIVGEEIPGVPRFAVVLADRAPLPLTQIGSPFLPRDSRLARLVQPLSFLRIDACRGHELSPIEQSELANRVRHSPGVERAAREIGLDAGHAARGCDRLRRESSWGLYGECGVD
jgi:hypothetical protein